MPNYIRYNSSTSVNRVADDPHCFGLQWESDDPDCRYNCDEYYRCGREFRRVESLRGKQRNVPAKSEQGSRGNGKTAMVRRDQGHDGLIRPELPPEMPPGTEYLPPGRHGPVKRAMSIAFAEGLGAGGGTFFDAISGFMRNIPAWHANAGRRTYGKQWDDQREPRKRPEPPEKDSTEE